MFGKRSMEDFSAEIQAHIELEADRLVAEGMPPDQALAAARRRFGNVTQHRERFYEAGGWTWLQNLARNVRYAFRQMRSAPVSAAAVVISLALGIGVNTAVFSLADQVLLRVLPVTEPDRLVQLEWNGPFMEVGMGSMGPGYLIPYLLYRDLHDNNDVFTDLLARAPADVHLATGDRTEAVTVEMATGSYFELLGVRPALGRLLAASDELQPDTHPVVVLSYDYWQNAFAGDPGVVGRVVRMNDYPMTIVGVAERGFHGMDWANAPAMWVPVMMKTRVTPMWNGLRERRARFLHVFGRLKPGITREQAQRQLQPWFKAYLRADTEREGWPQVTAAQMSAFLASTLNLNPGGQGPDFFRTLVRTPVLILTAATGLILLLACLNVANLSLARALAARRATALRTALGASRRRILSEQLVESAVLAAAGCIAGLLLAPTVMRAILSFVPEFSSGGIGLSASLDQRVLGFAVAVTAFAALISGAAPALYAASIQPISAIKQQTASVAGGFAFRKALVVGQFALAMILLIGAGLFARTLGTLRAQGPGFPTSNLLMFRLAPSSDGYTVERTKPLIRRTLEEIQSLPEVESAGVARYQILLGGSWNNFVTIAARNRFATDQSITMNAVDPRFFQTLGVSILRGRNFNSRDSRDDSTANFTSAIVNQEFVRRYLPNDDPLGVRLGIGNAPNTPTGMEIVGVVQTFHDTGMREPRPQVYFSVWEGLVGEATFYIRARGSSQAAIGGLRRAVRKIDPKLPMLSLRTLDAQLDRMLTLERLLATLAVAFALIATLLAVVGLYGVLSFSADRRAKEIGIRLALGARPWTAAAMIVREAAVLAIVGFAIAFPAVWALGRLVENQLYGVRPLDPVTIGAAGGVLVLVCLVASAVPARRAGSVAPLDALRAE